MGIALHLCSLAIVIALAVIAPSAVTLASLAITATSLGVCIGLKLARE